MEYFDTFDEGTDGWTNGKVDSDGAFGQFLGRYIASDPQPEKTYAVFAGAATIRVEFDFYEIDSWNKSGSRGPDHFVVFIDHEEVDLGVFDAGTDEGYRHGSTANGIKWTTQSTGPPTHLGFGDQGKTSFKDQIHKVVVTIPPSFFADDRRIKVRFENRANGEVAEDESAGIDNVKIICTFNCDPTPVPTKAPEVCVPSKTLYKETFQTTEDSEGWHNFKAAYDAGFGNFLGRYDVTDNTKFPSKTYMGIDPHADAVKIVLDFYEIDGWTGTNSLYININGVRLFIGFFDETKDEGHISGNESGIRWGSRSIVAPSKIGYEHALDQKHKIVVLIPPQYYADGSLTLGLEAVLSDKYDVASAGYDNIFVYEQHSCDDHRRGLRGDATDDILAEEEMTPPSAVQTLKSFFGF